MLFALLALPACGGDREGTAAPALQGLVREPPSQVDAVELPDVARSAAPTSLVPEPGALSLVYFGYTSCPDVCPTTLSDIRVALDDLPDGLAERVTVAMATVDPERDTDEVLTGYLAHFFEHGMALRTTDEGALAAAAGAFGAQYQVAPHVAGEYYEVAHTGVTYVVDDAGTVVVEWPFGFDSDAMAADLTALLTSHPRTTDPSTAEERT